MTQYNTDNLDKYVQVVNPAGASDVVLVCEHASHYIPECFGGLGLSEPDKLSHAAWDPGAMAVATHMSHAMDAPLVASGVSRLVYDCNRPPDAAGAMPARSEVIDVPGNANLTPEARADRIVQYYLPFSARLRSVIGQSAAPIIITVHSFTPIYHGKPRAVEIGILHDSDTRLADAMLQTAPAHANFDVQRNAPYGAHDGVTHTLQEHAVKDGHLNVMLEIRNDLIQTPEQQEVMGQVISTWLVDACAQLNLPQDLQCRA